MEQGKYRILFREQVFFLTKQGDYHHFETADPTFVNEDGTPVRLHLDKVRSVSFGLKVTLLLKADEIAVRKAGEKSQTILRILYKRANGKVASFRGSSADLILQMRSIMAIAVGKPCFGCVFSRWSPRCWH